MRKVKYVEGPLEVGRRYLVDCIFVSAHDDPLSLRWYPVLTEHVGDVTGRLHFHIDQRFMPEPMESPMMSCYGQYMKRHWKPMVCLRQHPTVYDPSDPSSHWPVVQERLLERSLVCDLKCRKCPHQGTDLRQVVPIIENGREVLVCPAHFYAFDARTGKMVRRTT